jgi:hypothetical protein
MYSIINIDLNVPCYFASIQEMINYIGKPFALKKLLELKKKNSLKNSLH